MQCQHATIKTPVVKCKRKAKFVCYKEGIPNFFCSQHSNKFLEHKYYCNSSKKYIVDKDDLTLRINHALVPTFTGIPNDLILAVRWKKPL